MLELNRAERVYDELYAEPYETEQNKNILNLALVLAKCGS